MQAITPLIPGYTLHLVGETEFKEAFEKLYPLVFSDTVLFQYLDLLGPDERRGFELLGELMDQVRVYRFLIRQGEEVVGWHLSRQTDQQTLNMSYSGLVPDHRGKGLYSALLPLVLDLGRKEGFLRVTSKHLASNNGVIVPKLKAGFCISGFEISEKYGVLVHLTYHYNADRQRMYEFRTGHKRIPPALREQIELFED